MTDRLHVDLPRVMRVQAGFFLVDCRIDRLHHELQVVVFEQAVFLLKIVIARALARGNLNLLKRVKYPAACSGSARRGGFILLG